jgi:adenosine/AMP kinase
VELKTVPIRCPDDTNVIIGQSHFIKTVEDIHELLVGSVPGAKFGLAFCEASGPCLIRHSGNDPELENLAVENASAIGAGHSFVVILRNCYPVNVLTRLKDVPEVCGVFCATANPVEVVVAETAAGRGILGVIDGSSPKGIEGPAEQADRHAFLRRIGYKL